MGRFLAVSRRTYRGFGFELHDGGATDCALVIYPPPGRGEPRELRLIQGQPASLGALIAQAKAMVDAVLGPRPTPSIVPRRARPIAGGGTGAGRAQPSF